MFILEPDIFSNILFLYTICYNDQSILNITDEID